MNVSLLEFNFTDSEFVTIHGQNVHMVFNFAETVRPLNLQNKSHAKYKAFTVFCVCCKSTNQTLGHASSWLLAW